MNLQITYSQFKDNLNGGFFYSARAVIPGFDNTFIEQGGLGCRTRKQAKHLLVSAVKAYLEFEREPKTETVTI